MVHGEVLAWGGGRDTQGHVQAGVLRFDDAGWQMSMAVSGSLVRPHVLGPRSVIGFRFAGHDWQLVRIDDGRTQPFGVPVTHQVPYWTDGHALLAVSRDQGIVYDGHHASTVAGPGESVEGLWARAPDDAYVQLSGGAGPTPLRHFDGQHFTPVALPIDARIRKIFWAGQNVVYALCNKGVILVHHTNPTSATNGTHADPVPPTRP